MSQQKNIFRLPAEQFKILEGNSRDSRKNNRGFLGRRRIARKGNFAEPLVFRVLLPCECAPRIFTITDLLRGTLVKGVWS